MSIEGPHIKEQRCDHCQKRAALPGRDICGRCVKSDVEASRPPTDEHELRARLIEWGWPSDTPAVWTLDEGEAFSPRWKGFRVEMYCVCAVLDDGTLLGHPEDYRSQPLAFDPLHPLAQPGELDPRPWVMLRWRAWKVGVPGFVEVWRDPVLHTERWAFRDADLETRMRDVKAFRKLLAIDWLRQAIRGLRTRTGNPSFIPNLSELQQELGMKDPKSFWEWRKDNGITEILTGRLTSRTRH